MTTDAEDSPNIIRDFLSRHRWPRTQVTGPRALRLGLQVIASVSPLQSMPRHGIARTDAPPPRSLWAI
ncbi:hypothetical protein PsYK624_122870 [Phanerochaete sordida]|uniref:Uncharacterized protein n=1 Tax=Phanerochaete sordida TaxID=48140 RepID=A0A9P3GMD4_9APHY|nr:hypothetical protein PsYK624_122870 [Phanerochaete sordida]